MAQTRTTSYTTSIRESLAVQGYIGTDPVQVEAWMREECGTLDGLTPTRFAAEVRTAAECVAADPATSARLAEMM